ncbi:hypothetical protein LTR02_016427 [Friedmanniomyces endolithicus]|nr:hypothetical protein LTR02_016427 [Friedmanniomyces endolithicus]
MAPARPALAQSESKARFFERLGLDDNNELHRRIYAMMKEEAVEAFKRLTENREALVVELRHTGLEPPFSHAQISETAIHREILHMYYHARPETRVVYDLAHDRERLEEENWVVRWLLWHVFRYRDNRNRNRRGPSNGSPGDDDDDNDDTESGDGSTSAGGLSTKGSLCSPPNASSPDTPYHEIDSLMLHQHPASTFSGDPLEEQDSSDSHLAFFMHQAEASTSPAGKRRPNGVERARARKAPWTQEAPSVPSQKPRDNLLRETDRTPGIEGVRHQQP